MQNVLEIRITKINEDWSVWEITHQDEEVFERGKFRDIELGVGSSSKPSFCSSSSDTFGVTFWIRGDNSLKDNKPQPIKNSNIPLLEEKVKAMNEKYGKRWRSEHRQGSCKNERNTNYIFR